MSEKVTVRVERNILHLPAIALRGLVVFPNNLLHFEVGREKSIAAVEWAVSNHSNVFLIAQKDMKADDPAADGLYNYGVVAEIKQVMRVSDDLVRILVEGKYRAKLTEMDTDGSFLLASVRPTPVRPVKPDEEAEADALLRNVKKSFDELLSLNPRIGKDVVFAVNSNNDPAFLCEYIPANLLFRFEDKQAVLEEGTLLGRLRLLVERMHRERRMLEIDKEIAQKVDEAMDKNQRDYYLHEQMHMISEELGEDDDTTAEAEEYRRKITALHLDAEREKKLLKEVDRLAKMQSSNQEGTVIRTYLDTCLELPWNTFTEDDLDIAKAQRILDRDHYGLKKVKDRILEVLAVRKLAPDVKGQIICLVGPPGVGKTSIARSIAESLNRKYVRISLGGVRDEAEIRGHRKTYIGAMPGRIIQAIKQAGTRNPVIVLDEVDKLGSDFRGDPSSALLEVLDPEQNHTFSDHYLNVPFDLSKVMFLCTANHLETIPAPLRDRMEVISLPGYTMQEKVEIAKRHLLPKKVTENGLREGDVIMDDTALTAVIRGYTREAGLRNLERELGSICRKLARQRAEGKKGSFTVDSAMVEKLLGAPRFIEDEKDKRLMPGMALGLAWTPAGGEVLTIECACMKGKGNLQLTGQLGDVMKESARIAMSYIRSRADSLGIDADFSDTQDIHIHVPAGAVPKDGPSAGVTLTSALISTLSGRIVRADTCMTGEITLQGRVLPVGGIKEKILAGVARGLKHVIIPSQNVKDLEEVPKELLKKIKVHPAHTYDDVLALAFEPVKKTAARAKKAAPATEKK